MRDIAFSVAIAVVLLLLLVAPSALRNAANPGVLLRLRTTPSANTSTAIDRDNTTFGLVHLEDTTNQPSCCYQTETNFLETFTPEFFAQQQNHNSYLWSGKEYEEWLELTSTPFGQALVQSDNPDCEIQWKRLVLDQSKGFYLKRVLQQYITQEGSKDFPYRADRNGLPRILLLGDSISEGVWVQTAHMYGSKANIHTAPTNCGGFGEYMTSLPTWLGNCTWDLIQFNVGMHFHPDETGFTPYIEQFESVVAKLREHSPAAEIVFALTTPTPFDSDDTYPDRETCQNYDLFHPQGFVTEMNGIASSLAAKLGVTVNDRYSAILPYLGKYQNPCDIHYAFRGYRILAKSDWKVFSELLSLDEASSTSACCYQTTSDLEAMYTEHFFEEQKNISSALWSGHEYDEWQEFVSTDLGKSLVNPDPNDCAAQWRRVVLEESTGSHLKKYLTDLQEYGESADYPFVDCKAGEPRFLLLGDAITEEVAKHTRELVGSLVNIHLAPTNPKTFQDYIETLPVWLGNCEWDLIQFDLGIKFHPAIEDVSSLSSYRNGLRAIISQLREHSPSAKIMLPMTTPSPLDRNTTTREEMFCRQGKTKFHPPGFVEAMNKVVWEVATELDANVCDRYSAILPHFSEYQKLCDKFFTPDGYRVLAEADVKTYRAVFPNVIDIEF